MEWSINLGISKLTEALAKAQGAMPTPIKNKMNPHFKSAYADHSSIVECSRAALSQNGLAITQGISFKDGEVTITTLLSHVSGEWIKTELSLKPEKPTPQGIGSAATYGRRYSHAAILGLAPDDDDDGNEASPPPEKEKERERYQGTPSQKQTLLGIFNSLGIDSPEGMKALSDECMGIPMDSLEPFLKGRRKVTYTKKEEPNAPE